MKCRQAKPILSAFYDDELGGKARREVEGHLKACPQCDSGIDAFRHLSALLQVPAAEGEADPGFLARFRQRREQALASAWLRQPWKWLAVRLVPLAATALLAAGAMLWLGNDRPDAVRQLGANEIRRGLVEVTEETPGLEPVLGITFVDFGTGGGRR